MELNCDNCKYGEAEYMGDEPCLSCGKHFDRWVKTEKPINSGYPPLADVLDKWRLLHNITKDDPIYSDLIKLLEKHFS